MKCLEKKIIVFINKLYFIIKNTMLYLIPTPIWNIDDITIRALNLLKELPILICEDTRTTKKLLNMLNIWYENKQFFSLTSFTNQGKLNHYLNLLKENDIWMLSDAWTPWLSDPWKQLIQICSENNLPYTILPGANALIPAVVWSWFDTSSFCYMGFLPQKKWRQTALKECIERNIPTFFYESVHRIEKLIKELDELNYSWKISMTREISKLFEEHITCSFEELKNKFEKKEIQIKGEFVIGLYPIK